MVIQKVAEKPYVEPSIWQHLQLLRTSKGLRNLVLNTGADGDIKLVWHALDKLQERKSWLQLWEVVFRSKTDSWKREAATERLFSTQVDETKLKSIGEELRKWVCFKSYKVKERAKRNMDAEAADLLCTWMRRNNMWSPLSSICSFGGDIFEPAAKAQFNDLTIGEADYIFNYDPHLAHDILQDDIKDPVVKKRLEGGLAKAEKRFGDEQRGN